GGALVVAHGHDDSALLGCQMFVDSRHGGTLQQKVLHLVFENTGNTIWITQSLSICLTSSNLLLLSKVQNYTKKLMVIGTK
ncbi:hypothetical protein, partial [Pseudoduganella aquatica]|uniref:hypothetical protein n=1 Tax=Pseudoduganella aquatica TaxID=2660641 RepID=UPI001CB6CB97